MSVFNGTGGTGGVNFKVVGGTTAPTNPKENTIWVKTDIDIPYWTTTASANTPGYVAKKGTVTFWWESAKDTEVSGTTAAGFMPVKYKATNPPGYMRLKPINCYQNQDGTSSGWKRMNAYIYKSGSWVQFSTEFAATIAVTYPEGSTCTCTDGSMTITAPNTTGSYTFVVPNTGTWTLTCTDGDQTVSDAVSITADGQSASVELSYRIYYSPGNEHTSTTGGWSAVNSDSSATMTLTKSSDCMKFDLVRPSWSSGGYTAILKTEKAVDLTNVSNLCFDIYCKGSYKQFSFGASKNGDSNFAAKLENGSMDDFTISRGVYTVDVSSLSGKHYIAIYIYTATVTTGALEIYNVYGE